MADSFASRSHLRGGGRATSLITVVIVYDSMPMGRPHLATDATWARVGREIAPAKCFTLTLSRAKTMNKFLVVLATAALSTVFTAAAYAAPTTFFGQDQNPGSSTTNSDTAHSQFLSNLSSGVGTENFEGIAGGNYGSLALTFPGSTGNITATLSGSLLICTNNGCGGAGRFATSGTHYLDTSDNFTLTFSSPISAFGFYATDLGDINGDLTLMLTGGGTVNFTVPTAGSADGNQLFWGFIDPLQSYTGIQFGNTALGSDFFGFDDMIIGDLGQVQIGVPEPGALAMLGMGLLGMLSLVLLRRRLD